MTNRFSKCGHLEFSIITILAVFYLHVTPLLPTKFYVNWPFGSGEDMKNRFSSLRTSWISDPIFSIFDLQVCFLQSFKSIGLLDQ